MALKLSKNRDEICYPFIQDASVLCDFEVVTDKLCGHIGEIIDLTPFDDLRRSGTAAAASLPFQRLDTRATSRGGRRFGLAARPAGHYQSEVSGRPAGVRLAARRCAGSAASSRPLLREKSHPRDGAG
ncbi:hypothetical protein NA647_12255 [Pseudomonas stutzeri]|uniref:hypothetical protein n=1 Tax=Stutzerimonas stutzeri TaxID=316 RepID=UPI00210872BC|nr:hypothetical protein [Stutzerimonas stutzeri]MCQ4288201.1 hypothetical protein [Stutzerimonas stutzeri]